MESVPSPAQKPNKFPKHVVIIEWTSLGRGGRLIHNRDGANTWNSSLFNSNFVGSKYKNYNALIRIHAYNMSQDIAEVRMEVSTFLLIGPWADNPLPLLWWHLSPLGVVVSQQYPHSRVSKECKADRSKWNGMPSHIAPINRRLVDLTCLWHMLA